MQGSRHDDDVEVVAQPAGMPALELLESRRVAEVGHRCVVDAGHQSRIALRQESERNCQQKGARKRRSLADLLGEQGSSASGTWRWCCSSAHQFQ